MKGLIVNRSGTTPVLDDLPTDKVKVYATKADVLTDISNIEDGAIVATKEETIDSSQVIDAILERAEPEIENLIKNSGIPVGTVISMKDNSVTPVGYLECDGSTFDETRYPLLYAYLHSNVLPILGDELDFDNTEHLTYIPESGTATAATTFTYTATKPGLFIADLTGYQGTVGTVKVNGVVINETNSHSSTWLGFSSPSVPLKTGDTITIDLGYRSNMGYYNYQTFIPYKNHKYIKALSGVEDGPESTVVANAINTAVASLETMIENIPDDWVDVKDDFTFTNLSGLGSSVVLGIYYNKSLKQIRVYVRNYNATGASSALSYRLTYTGNNPDINFSSPTLFVTQSLQSENALTWGYEPCYRFTANNVIELGAYNRNSSSSWPVNAILTAKIEF